MDSILEQVLRGCVRGEIEFDIADVKSIDREVVQVVYLDVDDGWQWSLGSSAVCCFSSDVRLAAHMIAWPTVINKRQAPSGREP